MLAAVALISVFQDLFDNMYDLIDALTFNLRAITTKMWQVFEITYKLFKADAIDFLDGNYSFTINLKARYSL